MIAIIAILAAILFPVFAQAKAAAKKTMSLAHMKQLGIAVNLYVADSSDVYPITYGVLPNGKYSYTELMPVPATWPAGATPTQLNLWNSFWGNNLQPYLKSYSLTSDPGTSPFTLAGAQGGTPPANLNVYIGMTYNGLLHDYAASGVAAPSSLPLFWNGRGKVSVQGFGYANPFLYCDQGALPCRYVPPASGCSNAVNGAWSGTSRQSRGSGYNVPTGGLNMSFADTSAKWRKLGLKSFGSTDAHTDPFTEYAGTESPNKAWYDRYGCHSYLFRPDFDFQNWDTPVGI